MIDFYFRKWNLICRFSSDQWNKNLPVHLVFSNWVNFGLKKWQSQIVLETHRVVRPYIFWNAEIDIYSKKQNKSIFFLLTFIDSFPTVCWLYLVCRNPVKRSSLWRLGRDDAEAVAGQPGPQTECDGRECVLLQQPTPSVLTRQCAEGTTPCHASLHWPPDH